MGTAGRQVLTASGKGALLSNGKGAIFDAAGECVKCCDGSCDGDCSGGTNVTVDAVAHCSCLADGVTAGTGVAVTAGTWRITYCSGAMRTNNEGFSPFDRWNYAESGLCGGPLMYVPLYGLGANLAAVAVWKVAPRPALSHVTAAEAEASGMCESVDITVAEDTTLWFFVNDDIRDDSEGSITFHVKKL